MKEPIEALKQLCPSTQGINGIERSENQHDGVPTPFKRGHIANAMLEARLLSITLADRKSGLKVLIQLSLSCVYGVTNKNGMHDERLMFRN